MQQDKSGAFRIVKVRVGPLTTEFVLDSPKNGYHTIVFHLNERQSLREMMMGMYQSLGHRFDFSIVEDEGGGRCAIDTIERFK